MQKNELQIGINLGGWISQYPNYDHTHFRSFIRANDLQRIADWGFDHVRLPVDYPVLESDDQPGVYQEQGFSYIDQCLEWCKKHGMKMILDLHKAPGYAFDDLESVSLFNNDEMQLRLIGLWDAIANRYGTEQDWMALELLNEITLPDSAPWNALYPRLVQAVREQAPESLIVLGGNQYNAADQMQYLDLLDDDKILYTFHHYLPLVVTHYQAPWLDYTEEYRELVEYPGPSIPARPGFYERHPWCQFVDEFREEVRFDKTYLAGKIAPAVAFAEKTGQPVYCGEFGVIDCAPLQNRINWTRDVIEILNEQKIGRALWTYKALDFGLVDLRGKVISKELVSIASMH